MESPKGASANNIVLVLAQDHNVCNLAYIHLPKVVSTKNLFPAHEPRGSQNHINNVCKFACIYALFVNANIH